MITLEVLKRHLGISTAPDAELDPVLNDLQSAAIAAFEGETFRYVGTPEDAEVIASGGARDIWLTERPVEPAEEGETGVVVEEWNGAAWVEVPEADYRMVRFRAVDGAKLRRLTGSWPAGDDNIRITMQQGYAAGQEPADVRQAVLDMIALKYAGGEPRSMKSESISGYSYTRAEIDDVPNLRETLDRWRARRL